MTKYSYLSSYSLVHEFLSEISTFLLLSLVHNLKHVFEIGFSPSTFV